LDFGGWHKKERKPPTEAGGNVALGDIAPEFARSVGVGGNRHVGDEAAIALDVKAGLAGRRRTTTTFVFDTQRGV
jgi:hypothetical protein